MIEINYPQTASDRMLCEMGYDMFAEARQAVQLAALCPNEPVLDVATGSGRMALALAEAGHQVISGDIDEEILRETRERLAPLLNGAVEFRPMNASALELPDASMASVATANAMHHMQQPQRVLEEMTRVVKPDGTLLIMEFNALGFQIIGQVHQAIHHGPHENGTITEEGIGDFLQAHFAHVARHRLAINHLWIATGKKPAR